MRAKKRVSSLEIYYAIVLFILGSAFGSFYNVVGVRLPENRSIVHPPSHCDACKTRLKPLDLLPILSFLLARGKCKYCGVKYGSFHFFIELFTGLLFAFAFIQLGWSTELIVSLLLISMLAIITVSDICYTIIQNKILLVFGTALFIGRLISPLDPWWDMFAGAIFGFGLFFLLAVFSKGGMGGGDIKLYFVIGLTLGFKLTFVSIFLSSVIGLFVAVILKRGFGKTIPFGPSIAVGTLIAYFYGHDLFNWYMNLF